MASYSFFVQAGALVPRSSYGDLGGSVLTSATQPGQALVAACIALGLTAMTGILARGRR